MPSILNKGLGVLPAEIMQNFKEGLEPEPKKKKERKQLHGLVFKNTTEMWFCLNLKKKNQE